MRKMLLLLVAAAFFYACSNNPSDTDKKDTSSVKEPASTAIDLPMPYSATYSSKFSLGAMKNVQMVLDIFKQWDDNQLKAGMNNFADTVHFFANDWEFNGSRDAFFAESQKQRDNYTEVKTVVHAWIPVHSDDANEDWALIWSTGYTKDKKGVTDSLSYQDTWRINKNGKVDLVYQFIAHAPKPSKK